MQHKRNLTSRLGKLAANLLPANAPIVWDAPLEDLGLDSLDKAELLVHIDAHFGIRIPDEDAAGLGTLDAIAAYLEARLG